MASENFRPQAWLYALSMPDVLGCYTDALWDSIAQVLPIVPEETHAILSQATQDRRDVAKFNICCGLDTMGTRENRC